MDAKIIACPLSAYPGCNELTVVRRYRPMPVHGFEPAWLRRCADITQMLPTHLVPKR